MVRNRSGIDVTCVPVYEMSVSSDVDFLPVLDVVICYHCPCPDGLFAALIAREYFEDLDCDFLNFVPLYSNQEPDVSQLDLSGDELVYILDFDVSVDFIYDVAYSCERLVIIDHHTTFGKKMDDWDFPDNVKTVFDQEECAATLALQYFSPYLEPKVRAMVKYVKDHDLWIHQYANTRPFQAGIRKLTGSWDCDQNPEIFDDVMALDLNQVLDVGREIVKAHKRQVELALTQAFVVDLHRAGSYGYCLAVRGNNYQHLRSYIGNELAHESQAQGSHTHSSLFVHYVDVGMRGIGIVAYQSRQLRDPSKINLSFRGIGSEDTAKITSAFGGGGHRSASGCVIRVRQFNKW